MSNFPPLQLQLQISGNEAPKFLKRQSSRFTQPPQPVSSIPKPENMLEMLLGDFEKDFSGVHIQKPVAVGQSRELTEDQMKNINLQLRTDALQNEEKVERQNTELAAMKDTVKKFERKFKDQDDVITDLKKEVAELRQLIQSHLNSSGSTRASPGMFNVGNHVIDEESSNISQTVSRYGSSEQSFPVSVQITNLPSVQNNPVTQRQISQTQPPLHKITSGSNTISNFNHSSKLRSQNSSHSLLESRPTLRNQLSYQSSFNRTSTLEADEQSCSGDEKQYDVQNDVILDIAFLHSDALVVEDPTTKKIQPLKWEMTLNPEEMFEEMIYKLEVHKKDYQVLKSHLNHKTLQRTLGRKPKILVINCHGGIDHKTDTTNFWFEGVQEPSVVDTFSEERLRNMFAVTNPLDPPVKLVIISACHSSRLAEILIDAGIPLVVSISASSQVLELAAKEFNAEFLELLIEGNSVQYAFDEAITHLKVSKDEFHKSCCCDHRHDQDCLWYKYRQELGDSEKAHELHSQECKKCFSKNGIDHNLDCRLYQNFYDKLIAGVSGNDGIKNMEMVLQNQEREGYLKIPLIFGASDAKLKNKLCCCQSHLAHDESQKFILHGEEDAREEPIFSKPNELKSGKLVRHSSDPNQEKQKLDWVYRVRDSHWLFERNQEVHEIVDYIFAKHQCFLAVTGPDMTGRGAIIAKALMFSIERQPNYFRDGIFRVDLEGITSLNAVVVKISEVLQFGNPQPTEESLVKDISKLQNCLIYFAKCKYLDDKEGEGQKKLIHLFKRIVTHNDGSVKIIVQLVELRGNLAKELQGKKYRQIKIEPLSKENRYKFFKYQMILAKKQNHVDFEKIKNHPIFEKFDTYILEKIVYEIDQQNSFEDLIQQYDKKNSNLRSSKVFVKNYCAKLLDAIPENNYAEKNIIMFLTLTPAGLTEIELRQLCKIYNKWFGDFDKLENLLGSASQAGAKRQRKKNKEQSHFDLVYSQKIREIDNERLFKIDRDVQTTVSQYFNDLTKLRTRDGDFDKKELISLAIEFMGSYARSILRSIIKQNKMGGQIDYRLVTAHLDCGMWYRYPNEEESFNEIIGKPKERVSSYFMADFQNFLDEELLLNHFNTIWDLEKTSHEQEYIFDLCLTVPSILIELHRYEEAEELIAHCKKFNGGKRILLHARLELMQASIFVFKGNTQHAKTTERSHQDILNLLDRARKTFQHFDLPEGEAETFYVEALLLINQFKLMSGIDSNPSLSPDDVQLSHHQSQPHMTLGNFAYKQLNSRSSSQIEVAKSLFTDRQELEDKFASIQNRFALSLELFSKLQKFDIKEVHICNHVFGQAKVLLAETEFFVKFSNFIHHDSSMIDDYLEKVERSEKLFQERQSRNYEAMSICLQAKLKLPTSKTQSMHRQKVLEARTTIQRALDLLKEIWINDDAVVEDIKETKKSSLKAMRESSQNLFTFAKSYPLVKKDDQTGQVVPISDYTVSKFELAPKICKYFEEREVEVQVMFDFLNDSLLRSVAEFGTRVLHLTSDSYHSDYLFLEDHTGVSTTLKWDQIYKFFKTLLDSGNQQLKKLNIDCIVLAMPQSTKLGQEFKNLGVPHVVTFDFEWDNDSHDDFLAFRYNYIYSFCAQFYMRLIDENSVIDAFNQAKDYVSDGSGDNIHDYEEIWQSKDIKHYSLGITPILLDESHKIHKRKLFDSNAPENDSNLLRAGELHDISKARCQNTNVKKSKDPFIGHHVEIHNALKYLTSHDDLRYIVHVQGKRYVGKTRFLNEVAYRLLQRSLFEYKIQYKDMNEIKSEQEFKDMLLDLQLYGKKISKDSSGYDVQSVPVLIIFDNIDKLPLEVVKSFEIRLIDLIERNPGIRFLTSSKRTFSFKQFKNPEKLEKENKENKELKRRQHKIVHQYMKIILEPLDDIYAVDLLLSKCQKEITRSELGMTEEDLHTIHYRLQLERNVRKCKGLPQYLILLAQELYKHPFNEIEVVEKQSDEFLSLPVHHKAKHKMTVSFQHKISREEKKIRNQNSDKKEKAQQNLPFKGIAAFEMTTTNKTNESETLFEVYESDQQTPDIQRSRAGTGLQLPDEQFIQNTLTLEQLNIRLSQERNQEDCEADDNSQKSEPQYDEYKEEDSDGPFPIELKRANTTNNSVFLKQQAERRDSLDQLEQAEEFDQRIGKSSGMKKQKSQKLVASTSTKKSAQQSGKQVERFKPVTKRKFIPGLKKGSTSLNPINEEIGEPVVTETDDLADLNEEKKEVVPKHNHNKKKTKLEKKNAREDRLFEKSNS